MELKKNESLHSKEGLISYVRYSNGAIELHEDYVVFYRNLFNFKSCVHGRIATVVNIEDISSITYKGTGWFPGMYVIRMKHSPRPLIFPLSNWFVWTNKTLNLELKPIYSYIFNRIQTAWKNDKYRKVQTFEEIRQSGCCPVCGKENAGKTAYCTKCGAKLGEEKAENEQ